MADDVKMDVVKAAVEGSVELTLSTGEAVTVRPLSLKVLRAIIEEINLEGGILEGIEIIPLLLKGPRHLALLCGKEVDWFEDLPIVDELLIAETVFDISQMEVVIKRFLALQERARNVTPEVPSPKLKR